ncbi:MAG TPA: aromatic ring-hydroxylating dioxygenase subunit alpha [Spongiibacteraceae bacterium]|nr:aromatic ring-hydroxylating dioxygenase subunit alpha [Spongiibacteraceae bacterium]
MNEKVKVFEAPDQQTAWLGTDPIPAKPYYDAEYFELERKAIFTRTWLNIGHVSEIPEPGCFIKRELEFANASLLIVRGKDNKIRAFHNVCTHRATQLVEEASGRTSSFLCPYHMWNFGIDGELKAAPDFERFHVSKADCALKQVAVDVCAQLIFVNLDPAPQQGLRDYLGEMAEKLESMPVAKATTFSEYVYDIDANWKITYDNFQENYHLRYVHGNTGIATVHEDNPHGYPVNYGFFGPHRTQQIWSNPTPLIKPIQGFVFGKGVRAAMAQGIIGGPNDRTYCAVFPSLFVIGTPTQHFSHMVYPISATKSRGVFRVYWVGEESNASESFAREYMMCALRDVHTEDVNIIERVQKGLNSGALEHMHYQSMEGLCRHLYQQVDARVQAYKQAHAGQAGEKA